MVTWDIVLPIDQNGIIDFYRVRLEPLETFEGFLFNYRTYYAYRIMTLVLRNLEEFVEYNISVQAYTSAGWSPYSIETTIMTQQGGKWVPRQQKHCIKYYTSCLAPSSPPENVTAVADFPRGIIVTWDTVPFVDQNGIITHYEIRYEPLEMFDGLVSTQTYNVSESQSVLLSNLQEFLQYNISIRAYTVAGWGPYSNSTTVTTLPDGMWRHTSCLHRIP